MPLNPATGPPGNRRPPVRRFWEEQANIAIEYATKRYRTNLINWGMLPFTIDSEDERILEVDDFIYIPGIRPAVKNGETEIHSYVIKTRRTNSARAEIEKPFKG